VPSGRFPLKVKTHPRILTAGYDVQDCRWGFPWRPLKAGLEISSVSGLIPPLPKRVLSHRCWPPTGSVEKTPEPFSVKFGLRILMFPPFPADRRTRVCIMIVPPGRDCAGGQSRQPALGKSYENRRLETFQGGAGPAKAENQWSPGPSGGLSRVCCPKPKWENSCSRVENNHTISGISTLLRPGRALSGVWATRPQDAPRIRIGAISGLRENAANNRLGAEINGNILNERFN
jgi:hypothetical protein